jgi:hypothetical protein
MNIAQSLGRVGAVAAVLGTLGLTTVLPTKASAAVIDDHGPWQSTVDFVSGTKYCGVRTMLDSGAELRLLVRGNEVDLVATDQEWNMRENAVSRMYFSIDGQRFTGTAIAISSTTLVLNSLTEEFVDDFIIGRSMVINFGNIRWNIDLTGTVGATADLLACVRGSRQGVDS